MKIKLANEPITSNYGANLLRARGVTDIEAFLHPNASFLQSPADLKNIGMAAAMYTRIVLNDKPPYSRILIIVD